jgi:hypothetical protein
MSKQEEASLILKLYDLRREATLREARDWFLREFHPTSMADVNNALFSEHSGRVRMVMTYWDMAAALVNHGAISLDLFNQTNSEHVAVFSRLEPLLSDMRAAYGPQMLANLEKLIDTTPGGRERATKTRERWKQIRAEIEKRQGITTNT